MHKLYWSFGEPKEDNGRLVCDFYYQTGRHSELCLPWPSQRFTASGDLSISLGNSFSSFHSFSDISSGTEESGRKLYDFLGKDAQTSLIRAFSNLPEDDKERILCLQFTSPTDENRDRCLALEDLPWELLHDGEKFITERYSLQIIRSYTRDLFFDQPGEKDISSWRILLISPFVFTAPERCEELGLAPLPQGQEEIQTIRSLEKQTYGLVKAAPPSSFNSSLGITRFSELEKALFSPAGPEYQLIHFVGHGLIYDEEPCLCFESETGGVDYVSVDRMRKLFQAIRDAGNRELPSVLFLNACGSSSRGRYSAGFASALHDVGISVLGYKTEVRDDTIPLLAARNFYQSLCLDQSVQTPYRSPDVVTAVGAARQVLRKAENESKPIWGSLRAYVPNDLSFQVHGRGMVERTVQYIYRFFSDVMNPADYTDHLSLGFLCALFFGTLLGIANLVFIFPQEVSSTYLTYLEILSELARIFMVGPLSMLVASLFIAWQTQKNHLFLLPWQEKISKKSLLFYQIRSLPLVAGAGVLFTVLYTYSFFSLELLNNQTAAFSGFPGLTSNLFWQYFVLICFFSMLGCLWAANWFYLHNRESLHSYRTYYFLMVAFVIVIIGFLVLLETSNQKNNFSRFFVWAYCSLSIVWLFGFTVVKILKEICWSASQKRKSKTGLSWQKLIPLLGGTVVGLLFYFYLEESARFEPHTIHQAILEREADVYESQLNLQVIRILERALKQRAIKDIPDSIRDVAEYDWLLAVVCADYSLLRARVVQKVDDKQFAIFLNAARSYLNKAKSLEAEVQYKDYYCNIMAMVAIKSAERSKNNSEKLRLLDEALLNARLAVEKDNNNYAYLDTLAQAEYEMGEIKKNLSQLKSAKSHIRRAEWCSYFLRSYKAHEVQYSISELATKIDGQIANLEIAGS